METSLHQQLKAHYAGDDGEVEVRLGRYRIDVVRGDVLIEVQHAGLASIRDKIRKLCDEHRVLVVKPIVARRRIIKLDRVDGEVVSQRWSPKRGAPGDLFDELVHFTRAFPHPRLTLETPLVEVEEVRCPGHGRRRRWRRGDHVVVDQRLASVGETLRFAKAADLWQLVPGKLPKTFDTAELAEAMSAHRWMAQRAAYALREMGAVKQVGKRRGAWLYERVGRPRRKAA
ncbi:hypothetical protein Pla108_27490 [Botrimarina colliarenosi]|uniref:DUF8091 domain-containing protein n=1 Tax=Botrimarina colliarenosi TaxID=2528001 RepID=A0A5C6AAB7_9BACT|nr:hypothetical protein [Botrimarina colliarenosi]TWT96972.1 hypothetical protein Pla108_27490 [Botrimarina colliarenosi]